ncbi:MAG: DUF559 domain-containing protein [Flavobacterium sp.]|nr:MAG: DUF559 domain-containing protein [Flavobacterium sp.]
MKQFLFLFLLLSIHIAYAQQAYHISSGEFKCISDAAGIVVSIDDKNFSVGPALNEKRLTYTELNPAEFTRLKSGSNTISANDMIRDLSPGQLHSVKFSCTYPDASEDYCLMFNKFLFASFRKANSEEPAKFDKLSPFAFIEIDGLTHQWESVAVKDLSREKALSEIGFTIIRFNDEEILKDLENVNRAICFYIEEFEKR